MSNNPLRDFQHATYKISQYALMINAAKRGRLPQYLIKRQYHRTVISQLRKAKLW